MASDILFQGLLDKKSPKGLPGCHIWQKRFFVLTQQGIFYFKPNKFLLQNLNSPNPINNIKLLLQTYDIQPKGVIRLTEIKSIKVKAPTGLSNLIHSKEEQEKQEEGKINNLGALASSSSDSLDLESSGTFNRFGFDIRIHSARLFCIKTTTLQSAKEWIKMIEEAISLNKQSGQVPNNLDVQSFNTKNILSLQMKNKLDGPLFYQHHQGLNNQINPHKEGYNNSNGLFSVDEETMIMALQEQEIGLGALQEPGAEANASTSASAVTPRIIKINKHGVRMTRIAS